MGQPQGMAATGRIQPAVRQGNAKRWTVKPAGIAMCFIYDCYNEFSKTEIRKARKPHRCDGCCRVIQPGDQYQYQSSKCEGELYAMAVCNQCMQDTYAIVRHELAEGCRWSEAWPPLDEMHEYMDEHGMQRATGVVDLKAAKAAMDEFHKEMAAAK